MYREGGLCPEFEIGGKRGVSIRFRQRDQDRKDGGF